MTLEDAIEICQIGEPSDGQGLWSDREEEAHQIVLSAWKARGGHFDGAPDDLALSTQAARWNRWLPQPMVFSLRKTQRGPQAAPSTER